MSRVAGAATGLMLLLTAGCGKPTPMSPAPPPDPTIATAYILPGAVDLGVNAFGDEPVLIHRGEQLRWRNADAVEHDVVADTTALPEFTTTGRLAPGGERAFIMDTTGTTRIHCSIHPQMIGILVVQDR